MFASEEMVWESITDSASSKFDYNAFADEFPGEAHIVVFKIILDFAYGKPESTIAAELYSEVLMMGFMWDLNDIKEFLSDKKELFKNEIFVAGIAAEMLNSGHSPQNVLLSINPLLRPAKAL